MRHKELDIIECFLWAVLVVGIAAFGMMMMTGCSATRKIAMEITKVQTNATGIKDDATVIRSEVVAARAKIDDKPAVLKSLDVIDGKAGQPVPSDRGGVSNCSDVVS